LGGVCFTSEEIYGIPFDETTLGISRYEKESTGESYEVKNGV